MRYCRVCNLYTESCVHLERRKEPRGPFHRITAFLETHRVPIALTLIFGTLAYVVGGVWGLW